MAVRVFFLNRLREGVDPAAYEEFVQKVDYPRARRIPAITAYTVYRVRSLAGSDRYEYIETVDVTEFDAYRRQLESAPGREEFLSQLRSFIEASAFVGEEIPRKA